MKTLAELNEKMWYRALKVVYLFFAVICYLLATASIGAGAFSIYENHQDYLKKEESRQEGLSQKEFDRLKLLLEERKKEGDIPTVLAPESPHTTLWSFGMLLFIPWCYFWAWFVTKIPRWIFYYIVLGSIKPEK